MRVRSGLMWGLCSALLFVGQARADGFLDTVKNIASKPEVQDAAKQVGNKAVEQTKKSAGKSITGKLEGADVSQSIPFLRLELRIVGAPVAEHRVEDAKQLPHARDHRDFEGFAALP